MATVVNPLVPAVPSSVVTATSLAPRDSASPTPQSLPAVWAPSTTSKGTPRFESSRAAASTGGAPTPPATRSAGPLTPSSLHPLPQGPRTVEASPSPMRESLAVPSPTTA